MARKTTELELKGVYLSLGGGSPFIEIDLYISKISLDLESYDLVVKIGEQDITDYLSYYALEMIYDYIHNELINSRIQTEVYCDMMVRTRA